MFCPSCQDEFRPGFTRCERCDVDLVERLEDVKPRARPAAAPAGPLRMADYCGFFSLDDARAARLRLRSERIRSEIVIREAPDVNWDEPVKDEFWLRVDTERVKEAQGLLEQSETADGDFNCSECGVVVAAEASSCPGCGARFDE